MLLIHVKQAFSHCPKAFVRSNCWEEGGKGAPKGLPTHGDFAKFVEGSTEEDFVKNFNESYEKDLKTKLY